MTMSTVSDTCIACGHAAHVVACSCGCTVVQVATSEEVRAADTFEAHIKEAIDYNLGLGYRGDLWAWIEPTDSGTWKFHVARQPPVDDAGRFKFQVMRFDLSKGPAR